MPSPNSGFRPPHCPSATCDSHVRPGTWRWVKKGFFERPTRGDRIQRYRCSTCGRSFSSQTFRADYWLKRPDLLPLVALRVRGCSGLRQIAQELGVAHATIQRQVERLGRHCLLLHEALRPTTPREPLVLDGLRSFESGQYWPLDLNLVVGASHFVYGFSDAELRRSGSMKPAQRRKRGVLEARYGRPDGRATRRSVQELLERVVPAGGSAVLHSDEHPAYAQAVARLREGRRIQHERTSSKAARTSSNPLFPVNLADLLIRHGSANHKRETIAFSKRRQGALYRLAIWVVWRNYMKPSSERTRRPPPGVLLGRIERAWTIEDVLQARRFPWRAGLTGWLRQCYHGEIPTRCLPRCRAHRLAYAC